MQKKSLPVKLLSRVQILHLLITSSLPPGGESNEGQACMQFYNKGPFVSVSAKEGISVFSSLELK